MIEKNKIYNESCLDTMSKIEDGVIDLTLTSPPYDDLRTYNKYVTGNKTEFNGYSFPFEDIAKELYRITKPGGVVVWVVLVCCWRGGTRGRPPAGPGGGGRGPGPPTGPRVGGPPGGGRGFVSLLPGS
jgi:hypothetical protein